MIERDNVPEEIEREIEQTRGRVSRDIAELGERLSPRRFKQRAGQGIAIAAMGAVGLWLLLRPNRRRISGQVRAAVRWLIANPTAFTTAASLLSLATGLLVPGNRPARRRLMPAAGASQAGHEVREAMLDERERRVDHLRLE